MCSFIMTSCHRPAQNTNTTATPSWEEKLSKQIPYLGHRNWIVIADMAYPLQSGQGITTIYADESYADVLRKVKGMIDGAPHIFAHIYNDFELSFIKEEDAPGVNGIREAIRNICGDESTAIMHEKLISQLDEAGRLFNVVIIKTPLTIPYTTTFFELDCAYWGADKQARLDEAVAAAKGEQ